MRTHSERSRHRRSVQLEFLENRSLLSQVISIGQQTAEVQLVPPAKVQRVPLEMTFEGTWHSQVVNPPLNPNAVLEAHVGIEAAGFATKGPWGQFTMEQHHTIDFRTPDNPSYPDRWPVSVIDGLATFSLSKHPGDTVTASYSGAGYLILPDPLKPNEVEDDYTLHLDLIYNIDGGTGRYQDATGQFTVTEVSDNVGKPVGDGTGNLIMQGPTSATGEGSMSPPSDLRMGQ